MQIPSIIIAIDGYSSTGKSSLAKLIAREFSFLYLDSGAMYRAVTLFAQEQGIISEDDAIDEPALRSALKSLDVHFCNVGGRNCTNIGGRQVEDEIRSLKVASQVSQISALSFVREYVDAKLRQFGSDKGVVMDGRDIGTTVFPDAELKVFLTASPEVRARRRFDEMVSKGESPEFADVLQNLIDRDYIDSHREVSPLRCAEDAFVLDNSDLSLEDEIIWVRGLIQGLFRILK